MKKYILIISFLLALVNAKATIYSLTDIPNVHVADSTRHVVNPDGILTSETVLHLDKEINDLWQKTSAEISVVVVDSIDSDDADYFATQLFTNWGIGKKDNDNGLLVLVAKGQGKIVIRTGYGLEGVIPDITAGRIIRQVAIPNFMQNNIDGGIIATTATLSQIISDPANRDEIMSAMDNNQNISNGINPDEVLKWWINTSVVVTLIMFVFCMYTLYRTRHRNTVERYHALKELIPVIAICSAFCLGLPLVVLLIDYVLMRVIRTRRRRCTNCGQRMRRLDEVSDNAYLTPGQDAEERINSVDYDVWLCGNCGETDILPYINKATRYRTCNVCHSRTASLYQDRIIQHPTPSREGIGVRTYSCHNCNNTFNETYKIPRQESAIILPVVGGGGSGFGGFGGGGSFGGGATGGGGASGSW